MSTRVSCSNPDCSNTILPATAAANGGLCAPCLGAVRQRERDEYVRLNRRTVDLYAGVTDPVEIARIMLSPRKYDPLIVYAPSPIPVEDLFAGLDEASARRLAVAASEALEAGETDYAEDIAKSLATLTDYALDDMLRTWVAKDHFWPHIIFRSAAPEIRDAIIRSLSNGTANANHALSALSWIGDDVVQRAFLNWDSKMPSWASRLHVPPSRYGQVAGWEVTNGIRRDLFHNQCLAVTPACAGQEIAPIEVFTGADQICPWCGHELSHMLRIDVTDGRFDFFGFVGPNLPVLTCHRCTCYGDFFAKVDANGTALPHPLGLKPKWLPDHAEIWEAPEWKNVPVALAPRRAIHAADWCMELKTSQIGGLPSWVQDFTYPNCPDCSMTMRFVAQLNEDDFPGHEGTYYAFLCVPCGTTATCYQQT